MDRAVAAAWQPEREHHWCVALIGGRSLVSHPLISWNDYNRFCALSIPWKQVPRRVHRGFQREVHYPMEQQPVGIILKRSWGLLVRDGRRKRGEYKVGVSCAFACWWHCRDAMNRLQLFIRLQSLELGGAAKGQCERG